MSFATGSSQVQTIALSGGSDHPTSQFYLKSSSDPTKLIYELKNISSGAVDADHDIEFTYDSNGQLQLNVNGTTGTDDPHWVKVWHTGGNSTGWTQAVVAVDAGETWQGKDSSGSGGATTCEAVIPTFVAGSGGGAPGTLGTPDTASFAGTTVQQIQWSITNGTSPTPNATYYLFNHSSGGTALAYINIGTNPQAGVTSTSTYQNPSGADFTGIWYVGYGQNATRVNLALYNFNPTTKKVFCNFW